MLDKLQRLADDIQHLKEDIATVELVAASCTGAEQKGILRDIHEIRLTIVSKLWQVCELQLEIDGLVPLIGRCEYRVDPLEPEYKLKVWRRNGEVVASEHIAWSARAHGYVSLNAYAEGPSPETHYLLTQAKNLIDKSEFDQVLKSVLDWDQIQWRFADFSTTPFRFSSTYENRQYVFRTQNPEGWHREDDIRTVKPTFKPRLRAFYTKCRVCGCTNDDCRQCVLASGRACSWVAPYLCSRCYEEQKGGSAQ